MLFISLNLVPGTDLKIDYGYPTVLDLFRAEQNISNTWSNIL